MKNLKDAHDAEMAAFAAFTEGYDAAAREHAAAVAAAEVRLAEALAAAKSTEDAAAAWSANAASLFDAAQRLNEATRGLADAHAADVLKITQGIVRLHEADMQESLREADRVANLGTRVKPQVIKGEFFGHV